MNVRTCTEGEAKLINSLTKHNSIKFDHEQLTYSIVFSDTLMYIEENNHFQITL